MKVRGRTVDLKARLDELYDAYNAEHVVSDPIWIVRRLPRATTRGRGVCAAALAFGRRAERAELDRGILKDMKPQPAAFVRALSRGAIVRRSSIR